MPALPRRIPADAPSPSYAPAADAQREPWQIRLGFLAGDISRIERMLLRRASKRIGGSHVQWRVLSELALREGATQIELADVLDLGKATMCGLVERMIRAGLVERQKDSEDLRVWRLYLTKKARSAIAQMRADVDVIVQSAMGHISDSDGERVVGLLEEIKANLLKQGRPNRPKKTDRKTGGLYASRAA